MGVFFHKLSIAVVTKLLIESETKMRQISSITITSVVGIVGLSFTPAVGEKLIFPALFNVHHALNYGTGENGNATC